MLLDEFKAKIKEVYEKSEADSFVEWPLVYDEDEEGTIFIDDDGDIFFLDLQMNWIKSHLNINNISKITFAKAYEDPFYEVDENDEPSESTIRINFKSGESICFHNFHESYAIDLTVFFRSDDDTNKANVEIIKQGCARKDFHFGIAKNES